ncbi:MAG: glycosyltransferase [Pseudomonadota bacterium]
MNGFHDQEFTIPALILRKYGLIPATPTILSPRGEFAMGALSLKAGKKRLYQSFVRQMRLTQDVWFHATAEHEFGDIEATRLPCRGILLAPNARNLPNLPSTAPSGANGSLRIAFLGRIAAVKNLEFALDVLARTTTPLTFDIYGPVVDPEYWARLEQKILKLPENVSVHARGPLAHEAVSATLGAYDLFFLPTLGENFGHAINEALASGVPVLISQNTPWRDLARKGAGWDLPLDSPMAFVETIDQFAKAPAEARAAARRAARALAEQSFAESDALEAIRRMLCHVMNHKGARS